MITSTTWADADPNFLFPFVPIGTEVGPTPTLWICLLYQIRTGEKRKNNLRSWSRFLERHWWGRCAVKRSSPKVVVGTMRQRSSSYREESAGRRKWTKRGDTRMKLVTKGSCGSWRWEEMEGRGKQKRHFFSLNSGFSSFARVKRKLFVRYFQLEICTWRNNLF